MSAIGYQSKNIEMLLTTNSDLHFKKIRRDGPVRVSPKSAFRPDRIFGADAYMKVSMIAAGVDSPWMLTPGTVLSLVNRPSINKEFLDMDEDFHI